MTKAMTVILVLLSVILILVSKLMTGLAADFFETLGVTGATVLTVKWLYDVFILKEHSEALLSVFKKELGNISHLTATSLRLGIREEFTTRTAYQERYGLDRIVSSAPSGTRLRIVGNTLINTLQRGDTLREALSKGLSLELCVLDEAHYTDDIGQLARVYPEGIKAALRCLTSFLRDRLPTTGSLELHTHSILLWDSLVHFTDADRSEVIAWELNFGPDPSDKRVFVLDATKPLGRDLCKRYDALWRLCSRRRVYVNRGTVEQNDWNGERSGG